MLSPQAQKEMRDRMRRIEGQARGVQRMLAEDRDCVDILTQLTALRTATYNASVALTQHFANQCLQDTAREEVPGASLQTLIEVLLRTPH
jgi:DNA-binding FrmR family transcriptional regulator